MSAPSPTASQFVIQVYGRMGNVDRLLSKPAALGGPSDYWRGRLSSSKLAVINALNDDDAVKGTLWGSSALYGADDCVKWEAEGHEGGVYKQQLYLSKCSDWTSRLTAALAALTRVFAEYGAATGDKDALAYAGVADATVTQSGSIKDNAPPLVPTKKEWWENIPGWVKWPAIGVGTIWTLGFVGRAVVPWAQVFRAGAAGRGTGHAARNAVRNAARKRSSRRR